MLTPQSDPARVRDAWAAVLEAGIVAQGNRQLRIDREDGPPAFCCLGVLCELALEAGAIESYVGGAGYPFDPVRRWAGLYTLDGGFDGGDDSLAAMNDAGLTFEAIAQTIRAEPDGLIDDYCADDPRD